MKLKTVLIAVLVILCVFLFVLLSMNSSDDTQVSLGPKGDVSIAVTGDVMIGRNMVGVLSLDSSPFEGVSNVTSKVDLLLINFENAATTSENAIKGDIPLKCDPSYVPLAKGNNNTVAALANNHATDYGVDGLHDTINYLKDANITPMGAGDSEDAAHKAVVENINGRKITILNYMDSNNFAEYDYESLPYANGSNPGYSAYNSADAQKQIKENNDSDVIIVFMHFGNEYSTSPNEDQEKIAHELIDYGADVVVGSHPHVPQGIEMYKGKPIFYSLGNFMFDLSGGDMDATYFVEIDLNEGTGQCTVYPVYNSNFLPVLMSPDDGKTFLKALTPLSHDLNITDEGVGKLSFNLTDA